MRWSNNFKARPPAVRGVRIGTLVLTAALQIAFAGVMSADAASKPSEADGEFFEKKIRPLLANHCFECHGPDAQEGGLRLDRKAAALKGGDSGPAIVPGKPEDGFLIDALNYGDVYQMPPTGKLPASEIELLTDWVRRGAVWPEDTDSGAASHGKQFDLSSRREEHWSWQPLAECTPPQVGNDWQLTPVDAFIFEGLQQQGLKPAPPADRRTWIRRVTYDLIGLPPTPDQVEDFVADSSTDAYEKVVDRLLASPHFGERWARHWLDLVRYAESKGHEFDYAIPNAYQYRDYVIRALNGDVPYDQFVIEHVAGDLLTKPRLHPTEQFNESVLGTGFWHLGEEVHSPVDIRGDETDRIDNKVDVLGKAFLGLTIACARCHDHKFDAISTKDYYSLSSFVLSSRYHQVRFDSQEHNRQVAKELAHWHEQTRDRLAQFTAQRWQPTLERLADLLLAAREVASRLDDPVTQLGEEPVSNDVQQLLVRVSTDRQLEPATLQRWCRHLLVDSAAQPRSPLHQWAVQLLAKDWSAAAFPADKQSATRTAAFDVIVDYARLQPEDWITDGFAFGLGPARPGDLRLSPTPAAPVASVVTRAAAEYDPIWDKLSLADGMQHDPGKLSEWVRAGRTLHTKTFTVPEKKLYYLFRGRGRVYASVDSHHLVNGPLHGVVVQELRGNGDFQWFEHDLTGYAGHLVHLEFTPKTDSGRPGDFALAMVVAAEQTPPLPEAGTVMRLSPEDSASFETAASALANTFQNAVREFTAGGGHAIELSPQSMELVNWLLAHPELVAGEPADPKVIEETERLLAQRSQLCESIRFASRTAPAMMDGNGVDGFVLVRGNHKIQGEPAPRQFLEALPDLALDAPSDGSGRLALAQRMVDPRNPYISRVYVNRLWHHLFGAGIVPTVDNFGVLGQPPSHPQLLDWLANWFVDNGWSLKKTLRLLVLSQTYRMSSQPLAGQQEKDPQNRWLHCMPVRRLQAEAIRDGILAVSGRLNPSLYGPSVPVHLTPFMDGRGRPESGPLDGMGRRSIYLAVRRNFLSPMMLAFDAPAPLGAVGRRTVSNVPAQALTLMNDPFVVEQARLWASRVLTEPGDTPSRIKRLYLTAFAREPNAQERTSITQFLETQAKDYGLSNLDAAADLRPWADLCHILIGSKEFIFLP